jgi:ubiquitin-protein ligase
MQNRIATPMDDSQMAHLVAQQVGIAWSPDQLVRLEHEWRQLQRNFAYHPHVRVTPMPGNPPAEYKVEFRARTLYIRDDGQLDYIDAPSVHIWLPPGYPHEAPVARPMEALFHPNITMDGIGVNPAWEPTRTLAQLVQQIGAVVAYHTYDPWNVWNPAALEWSTANANYLPTDPAANFTPNAGGEPLGRICQNGKATLEELRAQLHAICTALVTANQEPPSMQEVRRFAERVRLTTNLFLDDDVPELLRTLATELDQWAEALPSVTMVFEALRQRHIACAAALTAGGKLAESRRVLLKELASLSELVRVAPVSDPYQALGQLPPLAKMQAAQMTFRVVSAEAEKRLMSARTRLTALSNPEERPGLSHSALLEEVIETETKRATAAVAEARDKVESAIKTGTPIIERAKDELNTFGRVIGWREYGDLTAKSRELVDRIKAWGSAGVQAYFVENEGGVFGPFEFEQRLDLGESSLAVRNTGRTAIELFDLETGGKLAQSDTGETTIQLPGSEEGVSYETSFRMTARCDDLALQLEYLTRQISERLTRLSKPSSLPKAESWARAFDEVFSKPAALARFTQETRDGMLERDTLVTDLKVVARYKERMTTQFLLERYCEMVPRFRKNQAETQAQLQDANQRIAHIFARSQRDVETGHPMIPTKLAGDYDSQTKRRDDAQRKIDRLQRRFDLAVAQIRPRLASAALYGSATTPAPVCLTPLPQHLLDRSTSLRTEALGALVAALERDLNASLLPAAPAKTEGMTTPPAMQEVEEGESAEVEAEVVEDAAPMYVEEVDPTPAPEQAPGFAVDSGEDAGRGDWVDFNAAPKSNER